MAAAVLDVYLILPAKMMTPRALHKFAPLGTTEHQRAPEKQQPLCH
jgi:hypothetical protein